MRDGVLIPTREGAKFGVTGSSIVIEVKSSIRPEKKVLFSPDTFYPSKAKRSLPVHPLVVPVPSPLSANGRDLTCHPPNEH
jgi:hypothetical protein